MLCVALYLFNVLTGLGEMTSVCLNAHLLIDKLQIYRSFAPSSLLFSVVHISLESDARSTGLCAEQHARSCVQAAASDSGMRLKLQSGDCKVALLLQAADISVLPCGHPAPRLQHARLCAHRAVP